MQPNEDFSLGNLDNLPDDEYAPLPVAVYQFRATDMELKDTKNLRGKYIAVTYEVMGGQCDGRKVFQNYNVVNQNNQAVEIALREIKNWMTACGYNPSGELKLSDVFALEGKTFSAKTGVEKDKSGQYPDKTKIARFLPPNTGASPTQTASPAAPAGDKQPWEQ